MLTSFRTKLLLIFIGLLAITLAATLFAVLRATDANIRSNAEKELGVAERVFQELLRENINQLTGRAVILADDFAFRRAVATNEQETIVSALANHGRRIDADMILLMSPEAELIVSSHEFSGEFSTLIPSSSNPSPNRSSSSSPSSTSSSSNNPSSTISTLVVSESTPYQLVLVPVMAPDLIAWVGLGFPLDAELMLSFKEITKADISVLYQESPGKEVYMLSTLSEGMRPKLNASAAFDTNIEGVKHLMQRLQWLSEDIVLLDDGTQRLTAILSTSLTQTLESYKPLRTQMVLIASLMLLLAALVTVVFARSVTRPIGDLAAAAVRIASGDYTKRVALSSKTEFGTLGDALNNMQEAIFERERRIKYQADHDLLTDLPNRGFIGNVIKNRLHERQHSHFGLALLRLTSYQELTDVYGAEFSDQLLKQVAARLKETLRRGDQIGRVSDDQFMMFCDELDHQGVARLAKKIEAVMSLAFSVDLIEIKADIEMGFVLSPAHGDDYNDLQRRAHIALKRSRTSSGRTAIYEIGQDEVHLRQIKVTNRLQHAIGCGSFELHYQPKYEFRRGSVTQVEALLRWTDEELGRMFPDEFIPLAEHSGDITLISYWVLNQVIAQLKTWQRAGCDIAISMNLSARDILDDDFVQHMLDSVAGAQIRRELLVLEITESAMIGDAEKAMANLKKFYDFGLGLSMDDFGTGFSSLAQLKWLPVHELKIDKSFVLKLDSETDDQRIVRSIIELGHHLDLTVIAEGVENQASAIMLHDMGCDAIQGYYLSKALPIAELEAWLPNQPRLIKQFSVA